MNNTSDLTYLITSTISNIIRDSSNEEYINMIKDLLVTIYDIKISSLNTTEVYHLYALVNMCNELKINDDELNNINRVIQIELAKAYIASLSNPILRNSKKFANIFNV